MLQLFADLHPVFANKFLHHVDSDHVLICEVFDVAKNTALALQDPNLATPKSDALLNGLSLDTFKNVIVTFDVDGEKHTLNLNFRMTGRGKVLIMVLFFD